MTWAIDKRDVSHQEELRLAELAFSIILLVGAIRLVGLWSWAFGALVQLGVGISELDGDVSDFFLLMSYGLFCQNIKNTRKLTFTPEMALTKVDFPWAT